MDKRRSFLEVFEEERADESGRVWKHVRENRVWVLKWRCPKCFKWNEKDYDVCQFCGYNAVAKVYFGQLDPFNMPVRAENLSLKVLEKIKEILVANFGDTVVRLRSFFTGDGYGNRRFLLGAKGWGKTLSTLVALNIVIRERRDFLPIMLRFDFATKNIVMHNPLNLAQASDWGSRLDFFKLPLEDTLQKANCIILDDIHYVLESINDKKSFASFLELLKTIYNLSLEGCKVLLISENILLKYASLFKNKEFDWIALKFGQYPRWLDEAVKTHDWEGEIDFLAFREMPYFSYADWVRYNQLYGDFLSDDMAKQVIWNICHSPRSLIKLARLFKAKGMTKITAKDLFDCTIEKLKAKGVNEEEINVYRYLFKSHPNINPTFPMPTSQKTYIETVNRHYEWLKSIEPLRYELYLVFKAVSEHIEKNFRGIYSEKPKQWNRTKYLWSRLERFWRLYGAKRRIEDLIQEEAELKIRNKNEARKVADIVIKLYRLGLDEKFYEPFPLIELAKKLKMHWVRLLRLYNDGVLTEPFEKAFGCYLREIPSIEIIKEQVIKMGEK